MKPILSNIQFNKWIKFISQTLDSLYPEPIAPLNFTDPFHKLIAVLMSGNSTDKSVNKVAPLLFEHGSTPYDFAHKLSLSNIKDLIKPCGLAERKASFIKELSKIILEKYNGLVPDSLEGLISLPGVGRKTASVILVQHFKIPAFPVDTHIIRLANRWSFVSGKNPNKISDQLMSIFQPASYGKVHLQMIFYGREFCTASHNKVCPICKHKYYFEQSS